MGDHAKEERFAAKSCGLSERSANFIVAMIQLRPEDVRRLRGFVYHQDHIEPVLREESCT